MNKKEKIWAIILSILIILVFIYFFLIGGIHNYEKYNYSYYTSSKDKCSILDFELREKNCVQKCTEYYESCTCYGDLIIFVSDPPDYKCEGKNTCETINKTECKTRPI